MRYLYMAYDRKSDKISTSRKFVWRRLKRGIRNGTTEIPGTAGTAGTTKNFRFLALF